MKVLVTGVAGFVGHHVSMKLVARGDDVIGIDNVNKYYDPQLKEARLVRLQASAAKLGRTFDLVRANLADRAAVAQVFAAHQFDRVVHLAAQAGVRYSLEDPHAYIESNIDGFLNVIEGCRHAKVPHLTYASTSSVYGANSSMPFSEHDGVNHPLALYAATKRANELIAHSYSHLFRLPTTGLRFFTVYGPWGRPDMALFLFTERILRGEPIPVFNHGRHTRDFTYVEDIAEGVIRTSDRIATVNEKWDSKAPDPASSSAPFRIYNIGNNRPVQLMDYIGALEAALGHKAILEMLPLQPGDVPDTYADITELEQAVDYRPATTVQDGVARFVEWYRAYFKK